MKKIFNHLFFLLTGALIWSGCQKDGNYQGGKVSPYIPIYDLRTLYSGSDVELTADAMFGSTKITGIVVSDYSGKNMPEGLLVIQDKRRLQQLRGISIPIGAEASNYASGDSVVVTIEGGTLKRVNGILQVTNVPASAVQKVGSNVNIPPNRVPSSYILADPDKYESTLVAIVKGGFDPLPNPPDVLSGDKILNDGFENINLHTEASATFANKNNLPVVGNFFGIVFNSVGTDGTLVPEIRLRKESDIVYLSSKIEISPIIISGFMADLDGGDGNYEYMQFVATKDIDFSVTPFSVVVTNNAGATTPTGLPGKGWATGEDATPGKNSRTYKFNLTSGTAAKGTFFYVGGTGKKIDGSGSTDISSQNWIRAKNYSTTDGDGFGNKTSGLFANSGNASGFAVFEGTDIDVNSTPLDCIFIGNNNVFDPSVPTKGYRVANTDYYDKVNPITLEPQPFFKQGSNTISLNYNSGQGYFYKLGGVYNAKLGKWVLARTQTNIQLTKQSTLDMIEGVYPAPADPNFPDFPDGVPPTTLKQN